MKVVILQFSEKEGLSLNDISLDDPKPEVEEVVLQVSACGFSYHDALIMNGTLNRGVSLPRVLGHEISGVIVDVGSKLSKKLIGSKVVVIPKDLGHRQNGGFAEFTSVPFSSLVFLPPDYDPIEKACLLFSPISVAAKAVKTCQLVKDNWLIISGASGGLGIHAAQIAAAKGVKVIGITSSEKKLKFLQKMPWFFAVFMETEPYEEILFAMTDDHGIDAAIETTSMSIERLLNTLTPKGRLVLSGQISSSKSPIVPAEVIFRELQIIGSLGASLPEIDECLNAIKKGAIEPIVDRISPLSAHSLETAFTRMTNREVVGRILISPLASSSV